MTSETGAEAGQPLTPREQQVCEYLCLGWTNKEIAQALSLSSRTVEDHRAHVYAKQAVRNSVELVRKVYGITEFGPDALPIAVRANVPGGLMSFDPGTVPGDLPPGFGTRKYSRLGE